MDTGQFEAIGADRDTRLEDAIKKTAPARPCATPWI